MLYTDTTELWPEKCQNKTNGVTPRRFMRLANPHMSELISSQIGDGWLNNLDSLSDLEAQQSRISTTATRFNSKA